MSAACKNGHPHEPWGVKWQAGSWVFDTSTEAQYPRATACLVQFLTRKGLAITKPLRLHDKATAVQGKQTKKHRPLVPEYHRIVELHADERAPENSKQLPPHFAGGKESEEANEVEGTATRPLSEKVKYGIYHTPKQFLSMAAKVKHPMDSTEHLEDATKWALDFVFKYPAHLIKLERRKNLISEVLKPLTHKTQR